jgi:hypothetical protein
MSEEIIEQRLDRIEAAFKRKSSDDAEAIDSLWKAINQTNARISFLEFVLGSHLSNQLAKTTQENSESYKSDVLRVWLQQLTEKVLTLNIMGGDEQRQAEYVEFSNRISEQFMNDVSQHEAELRKRENGQ